LDAPEFVTFSENRFFGYDAETKKYDAAAHRDRIFGKHVADYMKMLKEEDPDAYKRQFSQYIAEGIEPDDLEGELTRRDSKHQERCVESPKKVNYEKMLCIYKISLDERKKRIREKKRVASFFEKQQMTGNVCNERHLVDFRR
ncbi:hypothetical protein COOONC_16770, partial [Cooperia oncophora]